jgi:hypothetical protein
MFGADAAHAVDCITRQHGVDRGGVVEAPQEVAARLFLTGLLR